MKRAHLHEPTHQLIRRDGHVYPAEVVIEDTCGKVWGTIRSVNDMFNINDKRLLQKSFLTIVHEFLRQVRKTFRMDAVTAVRMLTRQL